MLKLNFNNSCLIKRFISLTVQMAKSKYDYVKSFELDDKVLPNCWIIVRVDGKGFHQFSDAHKFKKPNDDRALSLMTKAAVMVMKEYKDVVLGYGQSDEYSFVIKKNSNMLLRRSAKIMTYMNSLFTSAYVYFWSKYFPDTSLQFLPSFDARVVLYPSDETLRDYLSWRQADCHINNLYNTVFWALVLKAGLTNNQAQKRLEKTVASDKNEILFSEFNTNYNNEPQLYRKGTILLRKTLKLNNFDSANPVIIPLHEDLIRDPFWTIHSELLLCSKDIVSYEWPNDVPLPLLVEEQLDISDKVRMIIR